jgi:hypothetical protein
MPARIVESENLSPNSAGRMGVQWRRFRVQFKILMRIRTGEKFMAKNKTVGILAGLIMLAIPSAAVAQRVYVAVAPPVVVERPPVAPGPRYVWVGGYQTWNGRAYVWAPGHWVLPPQPGRVWVPGHWRHNGYGWYWVPGHWR